MTFDPKPYLQPLDNRLVPQIRQAFAARKTDAVLPQLHSGTHVVLAGHRSAGKTSLLPLVSEGLGRLGVDLDHFIEAAYGRPLREWVSTDEPGFRQAEREAFNALAPGKVVAVGGGFLSLHGDLLSSHLTFLVPISFPTYCERLSADKTRPRLRPDLSLEDELRTVFEAREKKHAGVQTHSMVDLLALLRAVAEKA